ncbi:MAG: curli assembly protein CsgG [Kiritimatiellaeota bacterium]|nr:curli assembly protein CsgG [Kiritimatiellota bacterium]
MRKQTMRVLGVLSVAFGIASAGFADEKAEVGKDSAKTADSVYPVAIFDFAERNSSVRGMGKQVSDLLFAGLAENPNLWLVERSEMKKILDESELNLSGMVGASQAIKIGHLTGAKIIVTGSVFKVAGKTYLVAKIIGTETSRVLGKSVKGNEGLDNLAEKLAKAVSTVITGKADMLVAKVRTKKDIVADIKKAIGDKKRPKVFISVTERHIGQTTIDPAAQIELQSICKASGFTVTENENDADVLIKGEGFAEFATRRGNLVSVKARLELKALDKNGEILAVDRQTDVQVGLAERVAGKQALQNASAKIAERLLPKICK